MLENQDASLVLRRARAPLGPVHGLLVGYSTVGQWGGTCGNVCGFCEGATSCMNTGQMNFNFGNWSGSGNCGSDMLGPIICQTVHWTCVN